MNNNTKHNKEDELLDVIVARKIGARSLAEYETYTCCEKLCCSGGLTVAYLEAVQQNAILLSDYYRFEKRKSLYYLAVAHAYGDLISLFAEIKE